jgi:hypothetical protein
MAVAGLLLSSMIGGPSASAETKTTSPETYVGSAAGRALALKVASVSASSGVSSAKLDSTLKAISEGAGTLGLPTIGGANTTKAEVLGDNTKDAKPQVCANPELPEPLKSTLASLLTIGAACSTSLAEVVNGQPHAVSEASVLDADVTLNTLLSQATVAPTIGTVQSTVITPLLGQLDAVNKTIASTSGGAVPDLKVDDTIGDLLTRLQSTKTLDLKVGTSKSEVVTNGSTVTSTATSAGGVLGLLPVQLPLASGGTITQNLVEVVVGSAKASASYDRVTGKTGTPTFDPAIVTIRINTPTTDALTGALKAVAPGAAVDVKEIKINPGLVPSALPALDPALGAVVKACPDAPNEFCILAGTAFETRIAVASGRTVTNADGTVGAVADAVKIHALKNIGTLVAQLEGGILLELAHAEAGVGGAPAIVTELNPIVPGITDIPRELPRTGGTPWMPIAGVLGLALAVLSRRALVRSH